MGEKYCIECFYYDGKHCAHIDWHYCSKTGHPYWKPRPEVEKPKHPCPECAVCEMWSRTAGCCRDESEEFGECPYKHEEEVKP